MFLPLNDKKDINAVLTLGTSSVEVLEKDNWRFGPSFPHELSCADAVEHPSGNGVIVIGGIKSNQASTDLYFLKDGDLLTKWQKLVQIIKKPKSESFAILIPDYLANCTLN